MRVIYAPVEGEFDPVIGPLEQHVGSPMFPRMPMVLPFVPAELPDELAEQLLTQPGWKKAEE